MVLDSVFEIIIFIVTLTALIIASYCDFKRREVPNWLSYGLIFSALGIRTLFSVNDSWYLLLSGILGFCVCLALAYLFYYTNQWGGGDSKILMALGAVFGISYPFTNDSWNLLVFFILVMILGAIYGLIFIVYMAVKKREVFLPRFKELLQEYQTLQIIILVVSLVLLIFGLFYHFILPLAIFPAFFFYLMAFVSAVEKKCFLKEVSVDQLTEGDWLADDLLFNKKKLMEKKTLELKDLEKIKAWFSEGKLKKVIIREGIPFIPSFLLAYIVMILVQVSLDKFLLFQLF